MVSRSCRIAVVGSLLVILTTFVSPAVALVCGLLITVLALVASWLAFFYAGLLFDPLAPIVAASITHFAATAFRFLVTDRRTPRGPTGLWPLSFAIAAAIASSTRRMRCASAATTAN